MSNPIRLLDQAGDHPVPTTVKGALDQYRPQLEAALPPEVSYDRFLQATVTAINTNPDLRECERGSVLLSVMRCCQLGLEPATPLGHVWIVPFYDKRKKCKIATVIVGYKGFIDVAWASDGILISAATVRDGDHFRYRLGTRPKLDHERASVGERGPVTHAYAVATMPDGRTKFEVMDLDDLNAVMARSQSKGEWGSWKDDRERMQRKSPIRRLANDLPLNPSRRQGQPSLRHAAAYDDAPYDPSVLGLPETATGRPLFEGARGALPAEPTSIDLPEQEEPEAAPAAADDAEKVKAGASEAAAQPAAQEVLPWSKIVVVDDETGVLVPMTDELDWNSEEHQEAAVEALRDAIVGEPLRGPMFLKANARILGGFSESRKASLRHVVQEAKAEAKPPAEAAAENDEADRDGWLYGL